VEGPAHQEGVHRARIEAKRLRYLLEPLRGNHHADAGGAVRRLKRLQDVLGELHDGHVLAGETDAALAEGAAARAHRVHAAFYEGREAGPGLREAFRGSPGAGILAVVRVVRERQGGLYAELQRDWRGAEAAALGAEVRGLVARLEARAGGKVEAHRRWLLAALPPEAAQGPATEIAFGHLPGDLLRERIGRTRAPQGERYWRMLDRVGGPAPGVEEETSRQVFEALWPLTEGRRVEKRRYRAAERGLDWVLDQFTDRELMLAEVELPPGAPAPELPGWLAPHVLHEVTGDPAYQDAQLAGAARVRPSPGGAPVATPGESSHVK